MTDKFYVGEVAIYVRPGSPFYGKSALITAGLDNRKFLDTNSIIPEVTAIYKIRFDNDLEHGCRPEWLKKKKPPARDIDQIVSWDKCLWKPEGVKA